MFCPYCGKVQKDNANFCTGCGEGIAEFHADYQAIQNSAKKENQQQSEINQQTQDFTGNVNLQQPLHNQPIEGIQGSQQSVAFAIKSKKKILIICVCIVVVIATTITLLFTIGPLGKIKSAKGYERINIRNISVLVNEDILEQIKNSEDWGFREAVYHSDGDLLEKEISARCRTYDDENEEYNSMSGLDYVYVDDVEGVVKNFECLLKNTGWDDIEIKKWSNGKYEGNRIIYATDDLYCENLYFEVKGDDVQYYSIDFAYDKDNDKKEIKELEKMYKTMVKSIDKKSDNAKDISEYSSE